MRLVSRVMPRIRVFPGLFRATSLQEPLPGIAVNRHKPGAVCACRQKGPSHRLRNVVEFQVQENPGIRDLPDRLQNLRPLADEKLQTHLEETHLILQEGHVLEGLTPGGDIQREDNIVFAFFHGILTDLWVDLHRETAASEQDRPGVLCPCRDASLISQLEEIGKRVCRGSHTIDLQEKTGKNRG